MHARCVAEIKSGGKFLSVSLSSRYEEENHDNAPRDEYNAAGSGYAIFEPSREISFECLVAVSSSIYRTLIYDSRPGEERSADSTIGACLFARFTDAFATIKWISGTVG